jgi:hypothetical protein
MKKYYYATIAWDGLIVDGKRYSDEGEFTLSRDYLDDLVDGVEDYLIKWKDREAYLDLAAEEFDNPNTKIKEYTKYIKEELKKRNL